VEKYSKKTGLSIICMKKECGYKEEPQADPVELSAESKVQDPTSSEK
jgi:hypothetical protein